MGIGGAYMSVKHMTVVDIILYLIKLVRHGLVTLFIE